MDNIMKDTVGKLKELIDKNGLAYLSNEPYRIYEELTGSDSTDAKTAGAIMMVLVRGIDIRSHDNPEVLSRHLQSDCCFNKKMADRLAAIFRALYSKDNEERWKAKELEGWKQFLKMNFDVGWTGFSVWQAGNGSVDCHFNAAINLKPTESFRADKKLTDVLRDNPFLTKESIVEYYTKKLSKYLDYEFEEYCTCDDYYQPVVEDFEVDDRVQYWCNENGFEIVSCEGDGYDDGYEPSF